MLKKIIIFSFLIAAFSSNAKNLNCSATVLDVQVDKTGRVYAYLKGIARDAYLCDLTPDNGENEVEFCKTVYSTLLVAMTTKNNVMLWFNKNTNEECAKSSWANLYSDHGFYHLRLQSY